MDKLGSTVFVYTCEESAGREEVCDDRSPSTGARMRSRAASDIEGWEGVLPTCRDEKPRQHVTVRYAVRMV